MKHLLLFLYFFPLALTAQRTIVTDSTWITNSGGMFFENHITTYDNGEQEGGYKRLLGDTATLFRSYVDRIQERAASFASDARTVAAFPAKIKELIRQDAMIETLLGISPLDSIQAKHVAALTDTAWQIRSDGGPFLPVVFSVNARGNLRYKIDTFQIRSAGTLGEVIRLNNFLSVGFDVDLYKQRSDLYTSLDRRILLRITGSQQNAGNRALQNVAPAAILKKTVSKTRVKNRR